MTKKTADAVTVQAEQRTASLAEIRQKFKRPQAEVDLIIDGEALLNVGRAKAWVLELESITGDLDDRKDQLPAARAALREAELAAEDFRQTFVFTAIPNRRRKEIEAECPPTDEQVAEAEREGRPTPDLDEDRYAAQLISEMCISPKSPAEEWAEFLPELSDGQAQLLIQTCAALQQGMPDYGPKFGNAS